jgi:hypothetical protein
LAATASGICHYKLLDHNCKKPDFVQFITELPIKPGSTLVMDNVAFHHSKETQQAVRKKGCTTLYTLPYSPRLNAVEYVFSRLKHSYRQQCGEYRGTSRSSCVGCGDTALDYCALLDHIIQDAASCSNEPLFERVRCTVLDVIQRGGSDFCGYD